MSKKLLGGGIGLLVLGVILILVVQFALMPSTTDWEEASGEMEEADVGEEKWIEGEITSKEMEDGDYNYTLDDTEPSIWSTEDIGDEGDEVQLNVEKREDFLGNEFIEATQYVEGYPPLFFIGIVVAVIGVILAAVGYIKKNGEEEEFSSGEGREPKVESRETPPPPEEEEVPPPPEENDSEVPPPPGSS